MMMGRMWVVLAGLVLLAACSSGEAASPPPTQTLIPATHTPVPQVVSPTSTPEATLPRPADVSSPLIVPTATSESVTRDVEAEDPVAAELVALAQRRVAQDLNLPTQRIQLVEVRSYVWPDASLGCPVPGQTYPSGEVDGYRIVLSAGDREFLFHTDFDRALPCDAANEVLPEATAQP